MRTLSTCSWNEKGSKELMVHSSAWLSENSNAIARKPEVLSMSGSVFLFLLTYLALITPHSSIFVRQHDSQVEKYKFYVNGIALRDDLKNRVSNVVVVVAE